MLANEEVVLWHGGMRIRILGLRLDESRDPNLGRKIVGPWFEDTSPGDFTIVMGHSPDYIAGISDLPIDLCLAGHTHGGQIRIPFFGPPFTSSQLPRVLSRGFHEVGETRINISAGVGSEHAFGIPAIRFNCPTEMTVVEVATGK
jgi:predicted MPP superfamily phosphohydrolase